MSTADYGRTPDSDVASPTADGPQANSEPIIRVLEPDLVMQRIAEISGAVWPRSGGDGQQPIPRTAG